MDKIYSKVQPEKIIHVVFRNNEGEHKKMNFIVSEEETLQVAAGTFIPSGYNFQAHRHLPIERKTEKTQEAFVVISGSVKVKMYDFNSELLKEDVLFSGDCYVYLGGGHAFEILSENTFFYEIKNGPYYGRDKDKEFIS